MMGHLTDTVMLRLSAQRALLGAIAPNVLAVFVSLETERLSMAAFVDGKLDDDEREAIEIAASEIVADFPAVARLDVEIVQPAIQPIDGPGELVFLRYGANVTLRD